VGEARRIDLYDVTIGYWPAIDQLMAEEAYAGTFQETIVVFRWSGDKPSLDVGIEQDADELDASVAREYGYVTGRRYSVGGGVGFHTPELPVVAYYYRRPYRKPDVTVLSQSDINGEANAAALRRVGIPAVYRSVGDSEVVLDNVRHKIGANAACNFELSDLWMACTALVWEPLTAKSLEVIGKAVHVPPEKFEDKEAKTVTARITPIVQLADQLGVKVNLESVIDAAIEENVSALMQGAKVVLDSWRPEELEFIEKMKTFFEGEVWYNRCSTKRLCQKAPADNYLVGVAGYKSRKLIKASLIVDRDRRIHDILFTTDGYARPNPTVTSQGFLG